MADDQLSRIFTALADPTRRDMVACLAVGHATVGALAEPYDVSIQAVSGHIKVLTNAGRVTQSRDAQRTSCHPVTTTAASWIGPPRVRRPPHRGRVRGDTEADRGAGRCADPEGAENRYGLVVEL